MEQPGIETFEIVSSIKESIKPKGIIIIDSLCSKSIERLNKSIQVSDTGIIPGAGVGNKRMELSKESLGIPVIVLGIPTVVDAASLVLDTVNSLNIDSLNEDEFIEKMKVNNFNFVVTPKEIDELIENAAEILSEAINKSVNN